MTWIQTLNGKKFDFLNPDPAAIDPRELATVLSRICRFGGHCREFYSVAQHSVIVCDIVRELIPCPDTLLLPALLHDAHEAYWGFGDICRPAKSLNPAAENFFRLHADSIDIAVADRFNIHRVFTHRSIKLADNVALATEARDLMLPPPEPWRPLPPPDPRKIIPLNSKAAAELFLTRLNELWKE